MRQRQQVLYLWASGSSLDSPTVGLGVPRRDRRHRPGPAGTGRGDVPYATGVHALRDGWMLLQSAQLIPPAPGTEHLNAYLDYEFVFERRVDV